VSEDIAWEGTTKALENAGFADFAKSAGVDGTFSGSKVLNCPAR